MKTEYTGKDQIWEKETTRYWMEISGHDCIEDGSYGIDDCGGGRSYVDYEGYPVDQRLIAHLDKIEITDDMIND